MAAPYRQSEMSSLLSGGWREALQASLAGEWLPSYLGLEQLIKHALALKSVFAEDERHLVYCYWEPANGEEVPEVLAHRREVQQLEDLLGSADPRFYAIPYWGLFNEWDQLSKPPWLSGHLAALAHRYGDIEL